MERPPASPELQQALDGLEHMLTTTRGVRVQPPGTCVKPAVASDLDDVVTGVANTPAVGPGGEQVLLERVCQVHTIIHGVGIRFSQPATAAVADAYSQLRVFLRVNKGAPGNEPVGDNATALVPAVARSAGYQAIPIDLWNGVQQLTWVGLSLRPRQRVQLVVRRIAAIPPSPATDFTIAARWKGWEYPSTADTDRGDTFHAF